MSMHPDDLPAYVEHLEAELREAADLLVATAFTSHGDRVELQLMVAEWLGLRRAVDESLP